MQIFMFLFNSVLLGVGLAMDAFSVSIANGLNNPTMKGFEKTKIAGTFAGFQFLMPMLGWMFVHFLLETFVQFQKWIPWIALVLLLYIGGKMIVEAFEESKEDSAGETDSKEPQLKGSVSNSELVVQGIATSIDALSVGFTIADYKWHMATLASLIIGVVTFIICKIGLKIGIKVGTSLSKKAAILGGTILIFIGIEIFVKSFFA